MSPQNRPSRQNKRYHPARRGQTLIVAIAVLFVLLFIGGIFVAQVARNLQQAGRSREVQDAYALAEAGIRYCSDQLEASEDGADWRPAPTPPMPSPNDPQGLRDPDYFWLIQGFARVNQKGGRALVRVIYDPNPDDPRSHMLRIESVGRPGELDPLDPTVFVQRGTSPRLRRELIAYKQIGLTDYLRLITDKNGNGGVAELGIPNIEVPLALVLGDPTLATAPNGVNNNNLLFGGGIYSNPDLRLVGPVYLYTSSRGVNPNIASEGIKTAGRLLLEANEDVNGDGVINQNDQQQFFMQRIDQTPNAANALTASDNPAGFNSFDGNVRDGDSQPDRLGNTRSVRRLPAPNLDTTISATGVNRYRRVTRDSGFFGTRSNNAIYNTGHYGYGRNIYINNLRDLQRETSDPSLPGSYSLRADWINPNNSFAQGAWQGPFYRPPGVQVELLGDRIRFIRSDDDSFLSPNGTPITQQGGKVMEFGLSDFARRNFVLPDGTAFQLQPFSHDGDEPGDQTKPFEDKSSYGVNVVIMAEGNVRVRGVYGAITDPNVSSENAQNPSKVGRVHLTIVSGGTAYIEGNIVKGDGFIRGSQVTFERGSTCAILAKDYVCVNTTMFMSPQNQTQVWNPVADLDSFSTQIGLSRPTFDMSFGFGIDPREYQTTQNNSPAYLFLRHAASAPGPAIMNLLVNPAFADPADPLSPFYKFQSLGFPQGLWQTYALGFKWDGTLFRDDKSAIFPGYFEQRAFPLFPLTPNNEYTLTLLPGYENFLRFQTDTTAQGLLANIGTSIGSGGTTDYLLGGAFVAPLDIRIEAILYAQERSFFVIPGYAANADPEDTRQFAIANNQFRKSFGRLDTQADRNFKSMYPFYNDPIDVRITVHGAVAENYPASIADQGAWLARWGWIPDRMGNSQQRVPDLHLRVLDPVTINPGQDRNTDFRTPQERDVPSLRVNPNQIDGITRGLRFTYDPALALPYYQPTRTDLINSAPALRQQRALRYRRYAASATLPEIRHILPPAPRLPVCPDLLFFGDADRPLGQ